MNKIKILILKSFKKIYGGVFPSTVTPLRNWKIFSDKSYSNNLIFEMLNNDKPCMIGRFGSTEMLCLTNYLGVNAPKKGRVVKYLKGQQYPWWWEKGTLSQVHQWSGFFPATEQNVSKFCELMLQDLQELDLLGSWLNSEKHFGKYLQNCKKVVLEDIEPFFAEKPWTRALAGKKVLVVHPFADSIAYQYKKRELIFENEFLPDFQLKTIKAVQTVAGEKSEHSSWFTALDFMKLQMDAIDYDIAIIGCGAYGLPLAAHAKRKGKKAIHLAGVTQLLFGIKGKRWEEYIVWPYKNLFNEYWIRPGEHERPQNAQVVEGACYW